MQIMWQQLAVSSAKGYPANGNRLADTTTDQEDEEEAEECGLQPKPHEVH